ncbi:MAG: hypothetical protein KAY37_02490 [Phycisphaerae bacterium]|nr:hypothetical protein [Phycisphaerae bacterium]
MRNWITPRCILVVLMLIVAPGAALAHLLLTWAPQELALTRLNREIVSNAQLANMEWEQSRRLRQQEDQLRQWSASANEAARTEWLPRRDREDVFDQLAAALHDESVSIERLTLEEPVLYAAASRSNLLACECVAVECTGDYAGLSVCLDRLMTLDLPIRITHLSWGQGGSALSLSARLQVPFMPEPALQTALADAAGLTEEESDEP